MERMLAVILAGGRGKRMDILCHERPKPALPFAGGFRVIDFSLSNCVHSQIHDIGVLTDYHRSQMAKYLKRWYSTNVKLGSFHILEPKVGSYKGTADAVYQNIRFLQEHPYKTLLVLAGDHVYKMDYRQMTEFHEQKKADVTVGVITVPFEQAHRFGIVKVDPQDRIIDFVEKPRYPQSNLTSMGIYVFNKQVLIEHLLKDADQPESSHDFGYSIIPNMVKCDKAVAYRFNDYWQDIGTTEVYYEANMELIKQQPSFTLDSTRPVFTEMGNFPPPEMSRKAVARHSLISPGCVINGLVEDSIISPGVTVEEQAMVRNSIVMNNSFVGNHSVVDRCILDEGVKVGEFCYIGFGSSLIQGHWDITVVGKDARVPSHTTIGRGCRVLPGTTEIEFSNDTILHDSIVPASQKR
ncbi:glucose-1-phosphate adenylyltransferase family protein [Chloroflexota bacterium]